MDTSKLVRLVEIVDAAMTTGVQLPIFVRFETIEGKRILAVNSLTLQESCAIVASGTEMINFTLDSLVDIVVFVDARRRPVFLTKPEEMSDHGYSKDIDRATKRAMRAHMRFQQMTFDFTHGYKRRIFDISQPAKTEPYSYIGDYGDQIEASIHEAQDLIEFVTSMSEDEEVPEFVGGE